MAVAHDRRANLSPPPPNNTEPPRSTALQVGRQAGGTGLALVVENGMRYAAAFFAARALGVAGFGVYTLANTIVAFLRIVGTLGLSPGALPFLHRARDEGSDGEVRAVVFATLRLALVLSTLLALLVVLFAEPLALRVFEDPELESALRLFAGVIVLGALMGALRTLLQGFGDVWQQEWLERVLAIGVTCAVLALTWALGLGMQGAAAASYAGLGAGLLGAVVLLRRRLPRGTTGEVRPGLQRSLFHQSWPLMGTTMLGFTLLWSDVLLMGLFGESSEVGIYGASARLAAAGVASQEALSPILLTLVSAHFGRKEHDEVEHVYKLAVRWTLWPGMVVITLLFVWAPQWLSIFGPEFVDGTTPMRVLLLGKAAAVLTGMPGRMYAVTGLQRRQLFNMVLLVSGNLVLNCLWIPRHGMMGAAAATAVSLLGIRVFQTVQLRYLLGVLPWDRRSLLPIAGLLPLAGLAWLARDVGTEALGGWGWLGVAALFVGACAGLFLTVGVREEDRELWREVRRR